MKPAAVSHVLMKMEHRFTSFIELLFVCKNNRRQSVRPSSFSEFLNNPTASCALRAAATRTLNVFRNLNN